MVLHHIKTEARAAEARQFVGEAVLEASLLRVTGKATYPNRLESRGLIDLITSAGITIRKTDRDRATYFC